MPARSPKNPPPYLQQYGTGVRKRRRRRRPRQRNQRGGNILDILASNKAGNILQKIKTLSPTILQSIINGQKAYASMRSRKNSDVQQAGGFGPAAAMIGAQLAMPLLSQLINKI